MYEIWRQAYKGLNGKIKYSKRISSSKSGYANAFSKLYNVRKIGDDVYWNGLKLFLTEDEANKEIFDIDNYGK